MDDWLELAALAGLAELEQELVDSEERDSLDVLKRDIDRCSRELFDALNGGFDIEPCAACGGRVLRLSDVEPEGRWVHLTCLTCWEAARARGIGPTARDAPALHAELLRLRERVTRVAARVGLATEMDLRLVLHAPGT